MKIAIVGGSGFVGGAVSLALTERGHTVWSVRAPRLSVAADVNLMRQTAGMDVSDEVSAIAGAEVVVNCAGISDASSGDIGSLYAANGALPFLLAAAALEAGCRRFVHISTAAVQGRARQLDDRAVCSPGFSPYADSKVQGERLLQALPPDFVTVYRPPSVHAPGRRITRSLRAISEHGLGVVASGGQRHTPQALLENVADGVAYLATCPDQPPAIVIHPWEGHTTESILTSLGKREPVRLPPVFLRAVIEAGYLVSRKVPALIPNVRRAELMAFGQDQAQSWLTTQGWNPPLGLAHWETVGYPQAATQPKALITSSVASMIDQFNLNNIRLLLDAGVSVDVAANFEHGNTISRDRIVELQELLSSWGVSWHHVDCSREPFRVFQHVRALRQLDEIFRRQRPNFAHCHSPIGGALTRLVARRHGTPCVYTAHGFHFAAGAPLSQWLAYYPLERLLGQLTDTLVAINSEDFTRARRFGARNVVLSPGVGVDVDDFSQRQQERNVARRSLGLDQDTICLLSVGELNTNKDHETMLHALSALTDLNVKYIICGQGPKYDHLRSLIVTLGLEDYAQLYGYRTDVPQFYAAADFFVFPSRREGLPVAVIEAMASGLPVVGSDIRGVSDLLGPNSPQCLVQPGDAAGFAAMVRRLVDDGESAHHIGECNRRFARRYSVSAALSVIAPTYARLASRPMPVPAS